MNLPLDKPVPNTYIYIWTATHNPQKEKTMTTYLYPEEPSKAAIKRGLKEGKVYKAVELTPFGSENITKGTAVFSGPHYPKPHKYYGKAKIVNGKVVSIT